MKVVDKRRPRGFMTLGTTDGDTVLVRVAWVVEVLEEGKGSLLTMRYGAGPTVKESIGEVAEAMNAEDPARRDRHRRGGREDYSNPLDDDD